MSNPKNMQGLSNRSFSRRDMLKALGVGAFGMAAASTGALGMLQRARAQEAAPAARASAFFNMPIGDIELTIIQEGSISMDIANFGGNATEGAAATLLEEFNLPGPVQAGTVNIALVRTGDRLALLDTGLGDFPFPGASTNRLIPTLALLGIAPEDITDVLISHFHPDHIGGASTNEGVLNFPNATYHMPDVEWDFLQNTSGTPIDDLINAAKARVQPAVDADQFQTFAVDAEVLPGVTALHTPGHTPGHVSYHVASGSDQIFMSNDVANHYLVALANPDWYFSFDAIPDLAVETRRSVFSMLASEKTRVFGYHFPFPGVGFIDRDGEGFRYMPTGF